MATYTWATHPDGVDGGSVVSGTVLTSQAVALDDVFGGITLISQDSYRIAIKATDIVLDSGAGPFDLTVDGAIGDFDITLTSGDAANLADEDVVILKDGSGNQMVNQLRAAVAGGTVKLETPLTRNFPSATSTIERSPRCEVTGEEGVGGIYQGTGGGGTQTSVRTEKIWLTDEDFGNWFMTRLRYDFGSTLSIATFDWTGTIEVVEWIDDSNIYRSDRRTERPLFPTGSFAAPQAVTPFSLHFLSNGSGGKAQTKGFSSGSRYAEQHPPIRLNLDISNYKSSGDITIEGFRTIWSPIRDELPMTTTTQVRISPENFSQFQAGDVVDLWNYTTDVTEQRTISTKTAPDILTMTAAITGTYGIDDIIGIMQAETIPVKGAGALFTTDAWVYPLTHEASSFYGGFYYDIFQSVQGHCGALATVDPHQFSTGFREVHQNEGHYSLNIIDYTYGDGVTPTVLGGAAGTTLLLRNQGKLTSAATDSILWWGYKDVFGNATSCQFIARGRSSIDVIWNIAASTTNMLVMQKAILQNNRISSSFQGGVATVGAGAIVRIKDSFGMANSAFNFTTTDVKLKDCKTNAEGANEIALERLASGSTYVLNATTTIDDLSVLAAAWAADTNGPTAMPPVDPGGPIRFNEYNAQQLDHVGRGAGRATIQGGFAVSADLRMFNSLVSEINITDIFGPSGMQITSGITINVHVINEAGDNIESARVILVDTTGGEQFDVTTNVYGVIPKQEVLVERFATIPVGFTGVTFNIGDGAPGNIVKTTFTPFELIVLPTALADGYVPTRVNFNVAPWIATEAKNFTIVLNVPRPDGQFGDAGFDEF